VDSVHRESTTERIPIKGERAAMWERITAIGTVILIILTLVLISQGPAITHLNWPWFLLPLGIVAGLVVSAIFNFRTARLHNPKPETRKSEPSWLDKLADEDSADMNKRLILCGTSAKLNKDTIAPCIEVTFRLVNASLFKITTEKVEGNVTYPTYARRAAPTPLGRIELPSSDNRPFSQCPQIVNSPFTLDRGNVGEMKLWQFVPLEFTDNIANAGEKIKIDFSSASIWFTFPGTGGHNRFCWRGEKVEVAFPD